jgi:hypothetical protein
MSAKRTFIFEPDVTDEGRYDVDEPRHRLGVCLGDLIGTLVQCGGAIEVVADRVKIGELPGERRPHGPCNGTGKTPKSDPELDCGGCEGRGYTLGQPEPLGETVGFIVKYRPIGQLADEPVTIKALAAAGVIEIQE